ncbi:hypothetical protein FGG08_005645 [Glutinoglossum americanum]|uniref:Nephrocystin 3-like N-terminal domain-containing protein n=1 Tax=Glutinoglossum americanum TaxID=1670608 RepID=A0A9P8I911_9PEZI|nr:hypothetical protein FGG08_005645 [Glutinoglossum americanum]
MAEVSLAASVIAVIHISQKVVKQALEYGRTVKSAKKDMERIGGDLRGVGDVLAKLSNLADRAEKSGRPLDLWPTLRSMKREGGPLSDCRSTLNQLLVELTPANSGPAKVVERLVWPYKMKRVKKALQDVAQQKKAFIDALGIEQVAQILETGHKVEDIANVQCGADRKEILQWLSPTDPTENHSEARERHEATTGSWFINSRTFEDWKTAGCGKTVLSSTIIEDVRRTCEKDPGQALAYFYFDFSDSEKREVTSFLRSIVAQLHDQIDTLPDAVRKLHDQYKGGRQQPSMQDLAAALLPTLGGLKSAYIIVDALDECSGREQLLEQISDLAQCKTGNLHMLVTSRKERDIQTYLDPIVTSNCSIEIAEVDADIRLYVRNRLQKDLRMKCWPDPAKWEVEQSLASGACGMFRWAYCQIETLRMCKTMTELRKVMKQLPTTLDETYERILGAIPEEWAGKAHATLQWLAFSEKPLFLDELAEAAIMEPGNCCLDTEGRLLSPEDVLDFLPSLVVTSKDRRGRTLAKFAHYSVQEYIISPRIKGSASRFAVQEAEANTFISDICISYLLLFNQTYYSYEQIRKNHPLLLYAARYWHLHARKVRANAVQDTSTAAVELLCGNEGACLLEWLSLFDPDDPNVVSQKRWFGVAPALYYASMLGLAGAVMLLLEKGVDVNADGGLYGNALQAASRHGHDAVARILLENGADANGEGGYLGSALQAASRHRHEATARLLIENGADVNAEGGIYGTALQAASSNPLDDAIASLLIENGADVNAQGGYFGNPLQAALANGNEAVTRLLLKKGSDVNAQAGYYAHSLQAAVEGGGEAIFHLLLENGADVNAQGGYYGNALQAASGKQSEAIVRLLLEKGVDPCIRGGFYGHALQAVSREGHLAIARLLLEKGADVNAQGGFYGNALQAASRGGNKDTICFLIDKGADVNTQGGSYGNALQAACSWGREAIIHILLEKGVDVNAQGGYYGNALQAASFGGFDSVIRLLLRKGADPNAQGGYYGNALQAASTHGRVSTVHLLLDAGADTNAQGGYYLTALQAASEDGHEAAIRLLLENGAYASAQGGHHGNALHAASRGGHRIIVRLLLEHGADVNAEGGFYGNALQAAARHGYEAIVRLLFEKGADINAKGGNYGNALQAAAFGGHDGVIRLLLEHGADADAQGGAYGTAVQAALDQGHKATALLLESRTRAPSAEQNEC